MLLRSQKLALAVLLALVPSSAQAWELPVEMGRSGLQLCCSFFLLSFQHNP
jgi:hypothetical protein